MTMHINSLFHIKHDQSSKMHMFLYVRTLIITSPFRSSGLGVPVSRNKEPSLSLIPTLYMSQNTTKIERRVHTAAVI